MFLGVPVKLLVRQVPVVQIVDVDASDLRVGCLTLSPQIFFCNSFNFNSIKLLTDHVVVDEDFLGSGLHLVVIDVADDDGERRCSRNGRIAGILDDDRHMELLLLLAVERTQR